MLGIQVPHVQPSLEASGRLPAGPAREGSTLGGALVAPEGHLPGAAAEATVAPEPAEPLPTISPADPAAQGPQAEGWEKAIPTQQTAAAADELPASPSEGGARRRLGLGAGPPSARASASGTPASDAGTPASASGTPPLRSSSQLKKQGHGSKPSSRRTSLAHTASKPEAASPARSSSSGQPKSEAASPSAAGLASPARGASSDQPGPRSRHSSAVASPAAPPARTSTPQEAAAPRTVASPARAPAPGLAYHEQTAGEEVTCGATVLEMAEGTDEVVTMLPSPTNAQSQAAGGRTSAAGSPRHPSAQASGAAGQLPTEAAGEVEGQQQEEPVASSLGAAAASPSARPVSAAPRGWPSAIKSQGKSDAANKLWEVVTLLRRRPQLAQTGLLWKLQASLHTTVEEQERLQGWVLLVLPWGLPLVFR